jgi:hypothetical protein
MAKRKRDELKEVATKSSSEKQETSSAKQLHAAAKTGMQHHPVAPCDRCDRPLLLSP